MIRRENFQIGMAETFIWTPAKPERIALALKKMREGK